MTLQEIEAREFDKDNKRLSEAFENGTIKRYDGHAFLKRQHAEALKEAEEMLDKYFEKK